MLIPPLALHLVASRKPEEALLAYVLKIDKTFESSMLGLTLSNIQSNTVNSGSSRMRQKVLEITPKTQLCAYIDMYLKPEPTLYMHPCSNFRLSKLFLKNISTLLSFSVSF